MRIIPKSAISRLKSEQWAMCTRWSTVWAVVPQDRFDVYFGWLMSNEYTRMT